ncbi:hypothetical protein K450DRAFT_240832 [Umbelopsis ramanniana AG]|uniref:Major facilitator superfamily (MFS) profile domain-containing protein n=1 Tax=Umbelopsis ramanniana AG TaxID=1314678 RepID=A0AAD5E9J7_UMBRA|nr:uncharacterized protein K450DRAFT_240832 [Umbelopsis ramanniana AG]KAI8579653.1 hypothetical protein K450DRAFT_240832 [Umbelopsis ramanniana AG]
MDSSTSSTYHVETAGHRRSTSQDTKGNLSHQVQEEDVSSDHQSTSSPVYFTAKSKRAAYFTTIFSGAALFSDGYQSGIISFVQVPLKLIYGTDIFNATVASRISYSMFVGAVIGQLGFGVICDRIGRKIGLVSTTLLVIIGAAMCAASSGTTPQGLLWMLVVSRGIMGVGVGGEYPCSSVAAGESADEVLPGRRGFLFIMVTNFVIDLGYVISALVPIILLAIFGESHLEPVWRLCLGLGVIPPLSVLYFRLRMADPARYRKSHIKRKVPYWLIFKRYWRRLLTTGGLWFVYDFISYPSGVFSTTILDVVVAPGSPLIQTAGWNTLLYAFYLPGAVAGALLVDRIGRRKTMSLGFIAQGIIGLIMGGCLNLLVKNCFPMFVVMYGLFLMMGELGPGDTIGLVSAEIWPTSVRGTCYGISAAVGKVGATVGTLAFQPLIERAGNQGPFLLGSGIAILAGIIAFFCIPNIGPDSLEQEDIDFKKYLEENGFDTAQFMGEQVPVNGPLDPTADGK